MDKKAILTIDDIAPDREIVTVFGKDYELLDYEDMGLVKYSKFLKKYSAVGEQARLASDLDEAQFEALENSLTEMVEKVLMGISKEDAAKIPLEKKQKVLACFFVTATKTLNGQMEAAKKESEEKPTTAT